ncbi:MAG: SufD family Fe-S cluster assembly protein [Anaerolineales bacterium]
MTELSMSKPKTSGEAAELVSPPVLSDIQVEAIGRELGEPGWMIDLRRSALDEYRLLPMPSPREETWRHSDILKFPFAELPLEALALSRKPKRAPSAWLRPVSTGGTGGRIVLEDGFVRETSLEENLQRTGVVFMSVSQAAHDHPELLRSLIGKVVPPSDGKFAALASIIFDAGILLHVPKGVRIDRPLHGSLWSSPGGMRAERLLVNVEEGAEATLFYEYASPEGSNPSARLQITEISVHPGASLRLFTSQSWGKNVVCVSHDKASIERDGCLEWGFAQYGAWSSKTIAGVDLLFPGAKAHWAGFSFLGGDQQVNLSSWQNHRARETTSDFLYKEVLTESSRSIWRGMVSVDPGAVGADGYQANRTLMLSDQAKAESIPGLEILADDVHCSHGVSIGELDAEEIFYLRSRGISLEDSRRLLIDGFFEPVLEKISQDDIRRRVRGTLEEKLEAVRRTQPPIDPRGQPVPEMGG